jgi:predicted GTPase
MPGNQVVINNEIRHYVGDSKMEELLTWLDSNGIKQERKTDAEDKRVHE